MLAFSGALCSCSNSDDDTSEKKDPEISPIEVTKEGFPKIDCSTSTQPLSVILAAKILNLPYKWDYSIVDVVWYVTIDYDQANLSDKDKETLKSKLNCSTTHGSFTNLIDGKVELIIASRSISRDEHAYAKEKGVEVTEKPIGRDAFIFIVNEANKVKNLSISQIQDIYTGDITNWKDVGGNDAKIDPYIRNANSGSQEKMETIVMAGKEMIKWPEMEVGGMAGPFYAIRRDVNGIAYTPYYYYNAMVRESSYAKSLSINGIAPNSNTIKDGSYPYVSEIYAAVRSDIDKSSIAYQLYNYLTTDKGQAIVTESGYVPFKVINE